MILNFFFRQFSIMKACGLYSLINSFIFFISEEASRWGRGIE